jgi:hypothetical protein
MKWMAEAPRPKHHAAIARDLYLCGVPGVLVFQVM